MFIYLFITFQPEGIPDVPVGNDFMEDAFTNVPVAATPLTQFPKHPCTEMSVASIVMLLSFLQL